MITCLNASRSRVRSLSNLVGLVRNILRCVRTECALVLLLPQILERELALVQAGMCREYMRRVHLKRERITTVATETSKF
jgi:hypothetical protein